MPFSVKTLTGVAQWALICGILVSGGLPSHVAAQAPRTAMLAGQYQRYSPSECALEPRQETQALRDKQPDTLRRRPFTDRLAPSTVAAVRACLQRFNIATVSADELLGVGAAYLAADQDAYADSAFQRAIRATANASLTERARTLYNIVDLNMRAVPSRLVRAQSYLSQLDSLGTPAAAERLLAHMSIVSPAQVMDSIPLIHTHVQAAIAASRQLVGDSAKMYAWPTALAYFARADLELRRGEIAAARTTVREVLTLTARVRSTVHSDIKRSQAEWYSLIGQSASPLHVSRWLNGQADSVAPKPGKPSMLVFVSSPCGFRRMDDCYPFYVVLRRLIERHPTFNVTLMTRTEGSFRGRLVRPDTEATLVGDYFGRILKMHAPLAVWQTVFDRRADRYMMALATPNDSTYRIRDLDRISNGAPRAILVDASGTIRRVSLLTPDTETMLDREIGALSR